MTGALSDALMKLSAVKPAADSSLRSVELAAPAKEAVSEPVPTPAVVAEKPAVAADFAALGVGLSAIEPPADGAALVSAKRETRVSLGTVTGWLAGIRELRGWVATGIGLALLMTIVDDLWRQGAVSGGTGAVGNAAANVDLDELLQEFETAEPGSLPPQRESAVMEPAMGDERAMGDESAVTADYGAAEADSGAAEAGSGVVRFTGRIEPLR